VSRSIDPDKFKLQREGYAAAFSDHRVVNVITSGPHGRIAVCFIEWSGPDSQRVVIDWTPIKDLGAAKQFGDQLLEIPRSFADSTSISGGIDFALAQFARAPFDAKRRTIDVSGDGNNNSGRDVRLARDEAVAAGVTVKRLSPRYHLAQQFQPFRDQCIGELSNASDVGSRADLGSRRVLLLRDRSQ
jgi:hypothetical protein